MGKGAAALLGIVLLVTAAQAGAGEVITYTNGQVRPDAIVVDTLTELKFDGVTATQSGDITGWDPLTITGGSGVLSLTGTNTGFAGMVIHTNGTLIFSADNNLFGGMNRYGFEGDAAAPDNITAITAISDYATNPTSATESAMNDAITDARDAGTLPTFAVAAGSSITIDGNGGTDQRLTINTNKAGSFHLGDGATLTFTGTAMSGVGDAYGGAVEVGSGSLLALTAGDGAGYVFSGNSATTTSGRDVYGGAIFNSGTLTLTNADFTGNYATSTGGETYGGAIYNRGTLTLTNADFNGNYATATGENAYGGAISNDGTLALINADYTGNYATSTNYTANGGAIFNRGTLTVTNADFNGNYATATGDRAFGGAIDNRDTLTLTNTGFTGNYASGDTFALGGAIYNSGTVTLNVTSNERAVFTGNVEVQGGSARANSIFLDSGSSLAVNTDAGAVLDMRDPMRGEYGTNAITKSGAGTWKLGGANGFTSGGGNTTFAVNAGTLYLYRAGEVDNANAQFTATANAKVEAGSISLAGSGSSFTLASGAALAVGGGAWSGTAPNTITAQTITIGNNAALRFDLANHDLNPTNEMLTLNGNVNLSGVTDLTIDLSSLYTASAGNFKLVQKNGGGNFQGITYHLTLRGEGIDNTRAASEFSGGVTADQHSISVTQDGPVHNDVVTWTGTAGNAWNATSGNWTGAPGSDKFLHGDIVNFDGTVPSAIAINPDGDKTVLAAGMYVSGSTDYAFTGGAIELDGVSGTTFDGSNDASAPGSHAAASGKLVLGAKATGLATIDTTATFSGTVDLTGTGQNDFKGGVDLYGGRLRIAAAGQLGTALGRVSFLGNRSNLTIVRDAISSYAINPTPATEEVMTTAITDARDAGTLPTVTVAAGSTVTLDSKGGASQRLDIATNTAGSFHLKDGATLTFKGTAYSPGGNAYGGAVSVWSGSLLALTAGDGAGYVFSGNSANGGSGNYASGGAIYNDGTLTLTNADFTGNYATSDLRSSGGAIYNFNGALTLTNADFTGNYATSDLRSSGGAIYNDGTLALTNADFTGNYATSTNGGASGGAIDNGGTLALTNADFTGNYATSTNGDASGGAIDNYGTMTLTNADFTGNYASSSSYGSASGGAIYNANKMTLNVTTNERAVFTGNVEVVGGSARANSIFLYFGSSLAVNTEAGAVLDMRDPMRGNSGSTIAITKLGAGTWKLGGANGFTSISGGKTAFAVNEGTLYLYRADEVDNANATYTPNATVGAGSINLAGINSSFTLADGAVLAVGGVGHNITSGGTIAIAGDLAFDMTDATTATTSLTLTAPTIDTTVTGAKIGSGAITVSNFTIPTTVGEEYILVDTSTANTTANTGSLFVNGSTVAHQVNRSSLEYGLAVNAGSSQLLIKSIDASQNTSLTWTGAVNGSWNDTDRNWSGQIDGVRVNQFLDGDSVTFAANASPESIAVASGGVGVGTMAVNGDYNFSGGTIAASGAVTVAANKTLGLHIAGTDPALTAASINFNNTGVLKITGYSPADDVNPFENPLNVATVISTMGGVSNFNSAVTVEGQTEDNAFLTARAFVDGTDVKVETGLRWYSTDPTRPAHGKFTIAPDKTFTLGAVLADTSGSPGWNDKSLSKTGAGTLVLTAANTYTGQTTVSAGTLRLANQDAVAQSSGVTVDTGAILAVDQSSSVKALSLADGSTIAIVTGQTITATAAEGIKFTGTGTITVDLSSLASGSYDLLVSTGSTITGYNASNITTLIDGHSLSDRANAVYSHVTGTSDIVKLDLSINNRAVTWQGDTGNWSDANWAGTDDKVFYGGDSVAFTSGSGTVTVAAGGVQVADMTVSGGNYTFAGGSIRSTTNTTLVGTTQKLTVAGGSATFANDIGFTGGIAVRSGGALYGSSVMTGGVSVASGGTFGATAGGILSVDTLTMDAGSTFAVADANSRVDVTGTTSVAGGVGFTFGSGFAAGNTYTILAAPNAIAGWSGPFVDETSSAFLRYTVDAANNGQDLAVLVEEYRTLLSLGLTPNQAAVVSGLESWNGGSNELIAAVKALGSDAEALAALDALTGQIHRNLPSAMIRSNRGFWRLLSGPALSLREDAVAAASGSGNAFASIDPRACYRSRPLLWFSGGALYSRSRSDTDTARDRLNGTEFMVGGEAPLAGWNLGLAFRYADTRMKVDARSSRADLDNYQLGLYATRAIRLGSGHLRLTLGAGGGYHDIESRRDVAFAGVGQHLRSDYDAWSFSGLAEAGYRLDATPGLAVEPYVALGWDGVWNNSFAESGGSAALRGDSDRQSNLSTTLGTRLSYRLTERVSVDASAGWRHTYGNVRPRSGLAFAASPTRNSFTIVGSKLARDEFVGGLGVRVDLADRVFLRADYEVEAGSGGQSHQGMLSVGVGF